MWKYIAFPQNDAPFLAFSIIDEILGIIQGYRLNKSDVDFNRPSNYKKQTPREKMCENVYERWCVCDCGPKSVLWLARTQ